VCIRSQKWPVDEQLELPVQVQTALSHAVLETNAKRRKVKESQDNDDAELTRSNSSLEEARRKKRQVI